MTNQTETCDICQSELVSEKYDAKIPGGPWANMCGKCFSDLDCKLGLGRGQYYDLTKGNDLTR